MLEQTVRIKKEILDYLVRDEQSDRLESLQAIMGNLGKEKLLPDEEIFKLFYTVLKNMIHNRKRKKTHEI
jgi:hypothetical protein